MTQIIFAVDEPMTQTQIAEALRTQFHELIKLDPAARKARIAEILKPNKETANV